MGWEEELVEEAVEIRALVREGGRGVFVREGARIWGRGSKKVGHFRGRVMVFDGVLKRRFVMDVRYERERPTWWISSSV